MQMEIEYVYQIAYRLFKVLDFLMEINIHLFNKNNTLFLNETLKYNNQIINLIN